MHRVAAGSAMLLAIVIAGSAFGDSIWSRREPQNAFLFEDLRARRVGDMLRITINENTNAQQTDTRALSRAATTNNTATFKGSSSSSTKSLAGAANLEIDGSSARTFTGSGAFASNHVFTDFVTVTVADVLPNGNLVVVGYRYRLVGGENRMLRLTGMVRPADIDATNTIDSSFVASFQVTYVGRGPETNFTKQGFFGRAMNVIWPF
jgi:flagellar L-ring protein precursor FlgH